jgi:cell wall-associated NlpC family hydrolase
MRPRVALSAVAIGALSAGFGVGTATATPDYPSSDDVEHAKGDEAAKQAEIESLSALLDGLEASAAAAGRQQQIADEKYRVTKDALDVASVREAELAASAEQAGERARVSKMRAGLLAAHLARTAGGEVGLSLALDGNSDQLLYQLSAMGKLSEQSQAIYSVAAADQNLAESLTEQAKQAADERKRLADSARSALTSASSAAQQSLAALAEQQKRQGRLLEQLAALKNTTVEAEAEYRRQKAAAAQAEQDRQDEEPPAPPAAGTPSEAPPQAPSSGDSSGGSPSDDSGGQSGGQGETPKPDPKPGPTPEPQAPAPSPGKVAGAISYARAQKGEMYQLGGAGPDRWDCSGLTQMAYSSVGIYIGTHSATNQYDHARSSGNLVPYADRQPGDLIFYSSGGGDMYHVTLYVGGGMMIEAPYDGVPVREVPVRSYERVGYVARPTG